MSSVQRGAPAIPPSHDPAERWQGPAIVLLLAGLAALAMVRPIIGDEVEHVHAAWLVSTGAVPYRDFFEHHHPLLWFALAGLLPHLPETSAAVIAIRGLYVGMGVALVAATWQVGLLATGSPRVARLAALFLASSVVLLDAGIRVRPDVPMALCSTLALVFALRAVSRRGPGNAAASGLFAALAVLFLQKALLFLVALVASAALCSRRTSPGLTGRVVAAFVAGLFAPFAAGLAYLVATASLGDYVVTNWWFNAVSTRDIVRIPVTGNLLLYNLPLMALGIWGAAVIVRRRPGGPGLCVVGGVAVAVLGGLVFGRALRSHYLLQPLPAVSVVAAWMLVELFERRSVGSRARQLIVALLVLAPTIRVALAEGVTNRVDRDVVDHVLTHSSREDAVYDPTSRFNLFRKDVHYMGALPVDLSRRLAWYREVAGGRFTGYDECGLLREAKPRFVFDEDGVLNRCGLMRGYTVTRFPGVYARD